MTWFVRMKDGGHESTVVGYFLLEAKRFFSLVFLRFGDGSREAFHSHAFTSVSWVLKGRLLEKHLSGDVIEHRPSLFPVVTRRHTFHQVVSVGDTWVVSFRGPWKALWKEYLPGERRFVTLTHGRKEVA